MHLTLPMCASSGKAKGFGAAHGATAESHEPGDASYGARRDPISVGTSISSSTLGMLSHYACNQAGKQADASRTCERGQPATSSVEGPVEGPVESRAAALLAPAPPSASAPADPFAAEAAMQQLAETVAAAVRRAFTAQVDELKHIVCELRGEVAALAAGQTSAGSAQGSASTTTRGTRPARPPLHLAAKDVEVAVLEPAL